MRLKSDEIGMFISSGLNYAGDSTFDSAGNMWLANSYSSQINKYDSSGTVILSIGAPLWYPRSVFILNNGRIAVSDASYITYIFNQNDGTLISQFTMPGANPFAPWSSSQICRVMLDGDMLIFYNEASQWKLGKFATDGTQKAY